MTPEAPAPAAPSAESVQRARHQATAASSLGFAVLGCQVAGVVAICKAFFMASGVDVFFCLFASVLAFGIVCLLHLRRH